MKIAKKLSQLWLIVASVILLWSMDHYRRNLLANKMPTYTAVEADTSAVTLLFLGDIMGHMPQVEAALHAGGDTTYNYDDCFRFVQSILREPDLTVGNLEVTLAGKPYSGYPQFSSPDELLHACINAGIDVLLTANNHCLDSGKRGLERTLLMLDSLRVLHLGTYRDSSELRTQHPLIVEKNGIRVALLNYTYGTNGLKVHSPNVVSYIDKTQIAADITRAKELRADFVVVNLHWGIEYQRKQNATQEDLARFCFANGADLVMGGHPHVAQPVEVSNFNADSIPQRITVFSMGNFVSNQRDRYCDGGYMFRIKLKKRNTSAIMPKQEVVSVPFAADNATVDVVDYSCIPYWVYKGKVADRFNFYVVPAMEADADPAAFDITLPKDTSALHTFARDIREMLQQHIRR